MAQLEKLISDGKTWVSQNRRVLFWVVVLGGSLWLAHAVKELSALLFMSYVIALLLDPFITAREKKGWARGTTIVLLGVATFIFFSFILLLLLPRFVEEYARMASALPGYLDGAVTKVTALLASYGISVEGGDAQILERIKSSFSVFGLQQLRTVGNTAFSVLLSGYSLTLTIFNLLLVPFFIFYIGRDLHLIHERVNQHIKPELSTAIATLSAEILGQIRTFFRGQMSVSIIMAVLYVIGLSLVGVPSALVIGLIAGLLNIIPYFGVATGFVLAIVLTLAHNPDLLSLGLVIAVFVGVQFVEGNFLTPKIIGESMGIHPLLVIIALIVGGQLLGLSGLILAIPAVATVRVLLGHFFVQVQEG